MKTLLRYKFLFWILVSIGLFVFVLPIPTNILIKIIAGYVFYLFIKEIFQKHIDQSEEADLRVEVLEKRMENVPHKTNVYIHDHSEEDKKKEDDVRRYM